MFEAISKSVSSPRKAHPVGPVGKDDVTVVIPTLNEREAIEKVIEDTRRSGYHKILVVDGYSTDGSVEVAESNGVRVLMQHGRGKTGAIRTAIERVDTPFLVVMDGDCTYDPQDVEKLLLHLGSYDEVIGARVNGRENIPKMNRFGNWMITKTFNLLFGTNLNDVCSGMYALRMDFARTLSLETAGFDVEVEVAAQTASGGKITQVPIGYGKRVGRQKLSSWRHGLQIFSSVWRLARSYNPVSLFSGLGVLLTVAAATILFWAAILHSEALFETWYSWWVLFGVVLVLIAVQALVTSAMATLLKRMEQRIARKLSSA